MKISQVLRAFEHSSVSLCIVKNVYDTSLPFEMLVCFIEPLKCFFEDLHSHSLSLCERRGSHLKALGLIQTE